MSLVYTRISSVCHPYVTCMYSHVIRMSLVCTRMSSVCLSYVLVCHPYVTRMYSYVTRMSLVCTRMSPVCHSYAFLCHPYVTRLWFYHEPFFVFFSSANEIKTCGLVQQLILGMLIDLILQSRDFQLLNGDPPLVVSK